MNDVGYNIKKTTNQFISESINIHKNKFNYDKTIYETALKKVIITCKIHGDFLQTPNKHLYGQGCPNCRKNKKILPENFFEKIKIIHNDKYDYSLVDFKNVRTKIKIICKKHGVFEQIPFNHMNGQGCYKCGVNQIDKNYFLLKSYEIHNKKYDYSLIKDIKNDKDKIEIICPIHGIFKQRISAHLSGQGCRKKQHFSKGKLKKRDLIIVVLLVI